MGLGSGHVLYPFFVGEKICSCLKQNLEKDAHILIMVIWTGSLNYLFYKLVFWSFVFFKTKRGGKPGATKAGRAFRGNMALLTP